MAKKSSNAAEFTVSEISGALRKTIEENYGNVRVRGEISGFRGVHASGHAYFALKDEKARLEAVIWRTAMQSLKFLPQEGLEVIAAGRLSSYPGSSKYQIIIDSLEPAGAGALMALLEERRKKLAAEGLFDEARKKPLPFMPRIIGVITSPTGAVIRDIIHRINDRFPLHIIVWPVRVQGETAGAEAAAAIRGFNALPPADKTAEGDLPPRPDVLIVARGGGSLEDLWGFNDEDLARAAAESALPIISAVGHETDWTLLDYAADRRAPTPTAAAEMAVPVKAELAAAIAALYARLGQANRRIMRDKRQYLAGFARALPSADRLLADARRGFDEKTARLRRALQAMIRQKRSFFSGAAQRLTPHSVRRLTAEKRNMLGHIGQNASRFFVQNLRLKQQRLEIAGRLLQSLSHKNILARGFALIYDAQGALIRSAASLYKGQKLDLHFADGAAQAQVLGAAKPPLPTEPAAERRGKKPSIPPKQGDLF